MGPKESLILVSGSLRLLQDHSISVGRTLTTSTATFNTLLIYTVAHHLSAIAITTNAIEQSFEVGMSKLKWPLS